MIIADVIKIQPLCAAIKDKILPMKTSYKFAKLFSFIDEEFEFYKNQMALIINTYSEKDENNLPIINDNNGYNIQKDKIDICQKKIDELVELKITPPNIKFSFEELELLELTVEQFMLLSPFCEEEKEEQQA